MNTHKNLFTILGEWWDTRQTERRALTQESTPRRWTRLLPTSSNVIFTLVMIGLLVWAQSAGALPLGRPQAAPSAASTATIPYQGRLADADGTPLTDTVNMIFRLYSQASGGPVD